MIVTNTVKQTKEQIKKWQKAGKSIGFVPTMGYLHEGHQSLIQESIAHNDITVVSIFVNPTQFGANEDLDKYPRDFAADSSLCQEAGVDLIFHPEPDAMYPPGFCSLVDITRLKYSLCGKSRPDHFQGVCTVVAKLFNIVNPDRAYFGQKDAQQLTIIKQMAKDLDFDIEIVGCQIIREADGLAKSSRNSYLTPQQREQATILNKALVQAQSHARSGFTDIAGLKEEMIATINTMPLADIDYVEIVDSKTLEPVMEFNDDILIALAVRFGATRLIDNTTIPFKQEEK
ncbi:MAG: pantoate--beta-alanine ligase [Erysipelotrichaceae bacterium]|nr:pantoate--beta-alanine ligase [Erysipelotrichaceae bacterium]MDD3810033.1 pantoate--beta-alanine ligase [Erysipelotrichaceae bacterium]